MNAIFLSAQRTDTRHVIIPALSHGAA